jgi:hypothetical protein
MTVPTLEEQLVASEVVWTRLWGKCTHEVCDPSPDVAPDCWGRAPHHRLWRCRACGAWLSVRIRSDWSNQDEPPKFEENLCADMTTAWLVLRNMLDRDAVNERLPEESPFLTTLRNLVIWPMDRSVCGADIYPIVRMMRPHHIIFAAAEVLKEDADA